MKAVVQRVSRASVSVENRTIGEIEHGFLILLGVMEGDGIPETDCLAAKISGLRVFSDADGKMNRSLVESEGSGLLISNFTLGADCRKGKRPSFVQAARPEIAQPLYERFAEKLREFGISRVETGEFGADMQVSLVNDGPVTLILDTDTLAVPGR